MRQFDEPVREVLLVGLSHKTAPVDIRECYSLAGEEAIGFMARAKKAGIEEIVYVATCNRVEVYAASRHPERAVRVLMELLAEISSVAEKESGSFFYRKYSREAAAHLLAVASSLDSMVVGENEILQQLKGAYSTAVRAKMTGPVLNRLFHQAFRTAKRVRTETDIARNPLSVAFIAVELAQKIFDDISMRGGLLIGAGEMGELILRYFVKQGMKDITIANRSLANAERVAAEVFPDARVLPLSEAMRVAEGADIIVSSAASHDFVFTETMAREIMKARSGHPLFIIDIAVPRNIDPRVSEISDVFLYNIDDLKSISEENRKSRERATEIAMKMVEEDAREFMEWHDGLAVVPAISLIQEKFEEIRKRELARYRRKKLKQLSREDFRIVEELTSQIMTKTLHNPIANLKETAKGLRGHGGRTIEEAVRMVMEMFKDENSKK